MTDTFFAIVQVSERLQIFEKTVRRMLISDELPNYEPDGQHRIKPAKSEAWIVGQAIGKASVVEAGKA